jgi:hypothetical protein
MRERTIRTARVLTRLRFDATGGFDALVQQRLAGELVAGTGAGNMYCPSCRRIRCCDPVRLPGLADAVAATHDAGAAGGTLHMCLSCFYHFLTPEVSESRLLEIGEALARLGDAGGAPRNVIRFPRRRR